MAVSGKRCWAMSNHQIARALNLSAVSIPRLIAGGLVVLRAEADRLGIHAAAVFPRRRGDDDEDAAA